MNLQSNNQTLTISQSPLALLVMFGIGFAVSNGVLNFEGVSAQELISPGQSSVDGQRSPMMSDLLLPAPVAKTGTLASPSSQNSSSGGPSLKEVELADDPLLEYRKALEQHLLQKEKAKLEARARFESRSRDLIPKLEPTQRMRPNVDDADVRPLPQPELLPPATGTKIEGEDNQISSPSDLNAPRRSSEELPVPKRSSQESRKSNDRKLDDLLLPLRPSERAKSKAAPEPDRPTPAPLKRKKNTTPSKIDDRSAAKAKAVDSSDDDRPTEKAPQKSRQPSVLGTTHSSVPSPSNHWTGLVQHEMARFPQPASFRPYTYASNVRCSSCGGCVDRNGVGCIDKFATATGVGNRERRSCQCWRCPQASPFNLYGPGGYVGPARSAPLPEYRLRGGDQITLTFMIKTVRTTGAYRLVVGDELLVESEADEKLTRGTLDSGLEIQPDGTITLRFIGQVHAAGQTIVQLRDLLNERYEQFYPDPSIDVTPVKTGNVARQIREAISGSEGFNPQQALQTVTPEGTIRLPRLGAVPTQGLTMGELKREINLRYDALGAGLEVEINLEEQAPHFIYVVGEVGTPGQFEIQTPTTVLGALALAGSYVPGANLRQVVVFRRGQNWELLSTMLDLRGALLAKSSRPPDEIWLQDGDVVVVPPAPIQLFDRFVSQVFTEGIYGIVPFGGFSFTLGEDN